MAFATDDQGAFATRHDVGLLANAPRGAAK